MTEAEGSKKKGKRVTGALIRTKGKLGPRYPVDENPWDLIFDDERYIGVIRKKDKTGEEAESQRES